MLFERNLTFSSRFIARAKMHEVQMLGLLEHDVFSSIEVPFLLDHTEPSSDSTSPSNFPTDGPPSVSAANKFDLDIFALKNQHPNSNRQSSSSSASGTIVAAPYRASTDKRNFVNRNSMVTAIPSIKESPRHVADLPNEKYSHGTGDTLAATFLSGLSTSPSQSSIRSTRSNVTTSSLSSTTARSRAPTASQPSLTSKFAPNWLFKSFRGAPVAPQATPVSASASPYRDPAASATLPSSTTRPPSISKPTIMQNPRSPKPMTIKGTPPGRTARDQIFDEDSLASHRRSPLDTSPHDDPAFGVRRSSTIHQLTTHPSISPFSRSNPSRPRLTVSYLQSSLARRWQHMFPLPLLKHEIKWKSMVVPGCLPLTIEYFPTTSELESSYDVSSWHFVVDPHEMRSFLVNPPPATGTIDEVRRAWARVVMRGMAAVRLAQGFQFVLRRTRSNETQDRKLPRRGKSFVTDDDMIPKPAGAAEVMDSNDPIFLSMSNEIHRISYTGETIQVRRYVRRMPPTLPFEYQCLIWPKLGVGYTELTTSFTPHGLENYGWNR